MTNGGTLHIGGTSAAPLNVNGNGTFTAGTGTLDFNGTGAQTIPGLNYDNLTVSGSRSGNNVTLDATNTIGVAGNLSFAATFSGTGHIVSTTNTVSFNGTGAQTIGAMPTTTTASNYNNVTVNKTSGAATLAGNITPAGNLTLTAGVLDLATFTANRSTSGGALTVAANATLKIGGTNSFPTNYTTNTLDPAGTVEYNGSAQTVAARNYGNLTISGARGANNVTLANAGTIGIAGAFSPTATFGTGNYVITSSTIDFNKTSGPQTIAAFNYNNLTAEDGSPTNRAVTLASSGTVGIAGTFSPGVTNAYVVSGSTVDFNGAGAQTVPTLSGSSAYNKLPISGARGGASVTLASTGTIRVFETFSPTATFSGGGYVITGSTVDFAGVGQTIPAFNYNNLSISGANGTNAVTLASSGTIGIAASFSPIATFSGGPGYVTTGSTINF